MDKLLVKCAYADPTNYANGSRFVVFYYGLAPVDFTHITLDYFTGTRTISKMDLFSA